MFFFLRTNLDMRIVCQFTGSPGRFQGDPHVQEIADLAPRNVVNRMARMW